MAKSLVIVESPAKARTIAKYLGKGYEVEATMGHIRDLPGNELGIDLENNFKPTYKVLSSRRKIVSQLKKRAAGAAKVFLAPDLDREGEAIAWHVKQALRIKDERAFRVTFNEITKNAIRAAFEHPGKISMDKVDAQQARRLLDRLVGYQITPLLWKRIPNVLPNGDGKRRNLSAGRVQSVAVRLIVEREREIEAFEPEEFWRITAVLAKESEQFEAELELKEDEKRGPDSGRVGRVNLRRSLRRIEGDKKQPLSALHDKHASTGGLHRAALPRQENHATGPATLRRRRPGRGGTDRPHYLHADRQRSDVRRGCLCRPAPYKRELRQGVPAVQTPVLPTS
jgi:DNA topoisomerase IA